MSQLVNKSVATNLVVTLTNSTTGLPSTGILFSAATVAYCKAGGTSFTPKAIITDDWVELGSGAYTVAFTAAELDTAGAFTFSVNTSITGTRVFLANISSTATTVISYSVDTCLISDVIVDPQGKPVPGVTVSARILSKPLILNSVGFSSTTITAKTDVNGIFIIELARLAYVEIVINSMEYRRNLTVPNTASARLFSEIP